MEAKAPEVQQEEVDSHPEEKESLVYKQEEYAKKDFWNDRFKETKGFFDWYAEWAEIKPVFQQLVPESTNEDNVLMVGCGNSKLSEDMAKDSGYRTICNMDISDVVLEKMQKHNS